MIGGQICIILKGAELLCCGGGPIKENEPGVLSYLQNKRRNIWRVKFGDGGSHLVKAKYLEVLQ